MPSFKKWLKTGDTDKAVKKAVEIPLVVLNAADDVSRMLMQLWKERKSRQEGSVPPASVKTAAGWAQIALGGLLGGAAGNLAAAPARERAQAEYQTAVQQGPRLNKIFHPRPPRGTDLVMSERQGERYIRSHHLDQHNRLAQIIRHNLKNPASGGAYFTGTSKMRPLVLVPPAETATVLRHEIGHARAANEAKAQGKTYSGNTVASMIRSIVTGPRRTPLYRIEEDAWNRGGVDAKDPVRQAALHTYEAGLNTGALAGRGAIAGAAVTAGAGAAVTAGAGPLVRVLRGAVKAASPMRWVKRLILQNLRTPISSAGEFVLRPRLSGKVREYGREAAQVVRKEPDAATAAALGGLAAAPIPIPGSSLAGALLGARGYRQLKGLMARMHGVKPSTALAPRDISNIKTRSALPRVRLQFIGDDGQIKASAIVEVADTPGTRARGLMYRTEVPEGTGMFFDKAGSYWMKNVDVPLDVVFLDQTGKVLEKQAMLPLQDLEYPRTYSPTSDRAAHAVELPCGWFDSRGLAAGDTVAAVQA